MTVINGDTRCMGSLLDEADADDPWARENRDMTTLRLRNAAPPQLPIRSSTRAINAEATWSSRMSRFVS